MLGFERRRSFDSMSNIRLIALNKDLDNTQIERINKIKKCWNFYEGYHWEDIPEQDTVELTINYCRAFVNKFVAFELGDAFSFTTHTKLEGLIVTPDEEDKRTLFEYLEDVWEDNNQYALSTEIGQMKGITSEAWIQVRYDDPEELDDPFNEYPKGRVRVILMPTSVIFPEYDPHDREKLNSLTIMYTYTEEVKTPILGRTRKEEKTFKQIWTKESCTTIYGGEAPIEVVNKYGIIPFVLIKNFQLAGRTESMGDLDDLIPINTELNSKQSNVSEILDYHASPVTLVYGAKVGNLEKGANKLWGGLPKDSKVENLELKGDLSASSNYISALKEQMCEIGNVPSASLSGASSISNTSGVALQYMNMPIIDRTKVKKANTENGLERVNKLIILVSVLEGLIKKPEQVTNRDFYHTEVTLSSTLPKDELLELQQIQMEIINDLESRKGALKRLGRENIKEKLVEIDEEKRERAELSQSLAPQTQPMLNSGMGNGSSPKDIVDREMGANLGGRGNKNE